VDGIQIVLKMLLSQLINISLSFVLCFSMITEQARAQKKPNIERAALSELEKLFIRVWLHHFSNGQPSDIPWFIRGDLMLCKPEEVSKRPKPWEAFCVPALVKKVKSDNRIFIEVSISSGVSGSIILEEVQKILSSKDLLKFAFNETQFALLKLEFEVLRKTTPELRDRPYQNPSGRTYPDLEDLFSHNNRYFSEEILAAMQVMVVGKSKVLGNEDGSSVIQLHP
jgi:hypothetical protein